MKLRPHLCFLPLSEVICLDLQDLWRLCHHLQFLPHLHPKFLPLSEVICLDHQDLRTLCSHLWFLPPQSNNQLGSSGSSGATPSPVVSPSGSSGSTASSGQELTYISKYLVQYVPGTPKPKATTRRVPGYLVLASSKCLAELEEKESKKKKRSRREGETKARTS